MLLTLLFLLGYLASQVLVRVDAHIALLRVIVARTQATAARLTLGLMVLTFALSMVIPNVITVVAVLPLVNQLVDGLQLNPPQRARLRTVLALAVIYAANLGGVGSLTGSPHNGLLLMALRQADLPQRHLLTFWRWLLFGLPMAATFLLVAWGILVGLSRRALAIDTSKLRLPQPRSRADLRRGLRLTALAAAGAHVVALAHALAPSPALTLAACALTAAFAALLFLTRLPDSRQPVLRPADLLAGLPLRGVAWAFAAVIVAFGLAKLGALQPAFAALRALIPDDASPAWTLVVLVTVTVFLTELLSNTTAALGMWALTAALAPTTSLAAATRTADPLFGFMLAIGLAATCAFMSPLATPATGMAFGGLDGVRLRDMLRIGLVVNLAAIAWLLAALNWWIPWVLGF